jgi:hypothetical protein
MSRLQLFMYNIILYYVYSEFFWRPPNTRSSPNKWLPVERRKNNEHLTYRERERWTGGAEQVGDFKAYRIIYINIIFKKFRDK